MTLRTLPLTLLALLALALAATPALGEGGFPTYVSLLIGFPDDQDDTRGALVVPGTVLPVPAGVEPTAAMLEKEEAVNARLMRVAEGLRKTLRLETIDVSYRQPLALAVDELRDLPSPTSSSDVRLSIQLLGYDDHSASYEVRFYDRSNLIADTRVAAVRGQQAVVGGLDGEEAPYLFLVIEPAVGPMQVEGDVTPPRVLFKEPPPYPAEAKANRTEGIVVVQTVIDRSGLIEDVKVLRGAPDGLTEAAVDAVRQWRFEPALLDGQPVAVYYNLTINFRLQKEALPTDE